MKAGMAADTSHTLFVYGTLRKGQANHGLLKDARFLGNAKTREKYGLYVLPHGVPYATYNGTQLVAVSGEVYSVDKVTLEAVDHFEGHPYVYMRREVPVVLEYGSTEYGISECGSAECGIAKNAWMYFLPLAVHGIARPVPSGDFCRP
ncbi:MAG: gamma-glutamylcyclotransferase [Syntrophorhabdaceae bacterium]|nr:gamma-glutamylcyclotransferase [Syntrophorhabdaceae bacterium]MDD5242628.1 gamma-glutamylcyclotransferase [Syntrophorhabdaceae bacterium]